MTAQEQQAAAEGHEDPAPSSSREAAAHRVRARQAEQARDVLSERVQRLQRAEVERIAAQRLAVPTDLWLTAELPALLDDDGDLDADKVQRQVDQLLAVRPHWARPTVSFDGGARQTSTRSRVTFGDILRDRGPDIPRGPA